VHSWACAATCRWRPLARALGCPWDAALAVKALCAAPWPQKPYYQRVTEIASSSLKEPAVAEPSVSYNGNGNGHGHASMLGRVPGRPVLEVPDWNPNQSPAALARQAGPLSRLKLFSGSANQVGWRPRRAAHDDTRLFAGALAGTQQQGGRLHRLHACSQLVTPASPSPPAGVMQPMQQAGASPAPGGWVAGGAGLCWQGLWG